MQYNRHTHLLLLQLLYLYIKVIVSVGAWSFQYLIRYIGSKYCIVDFCLKCFIYFFSYIFYLFTLVCVRLIDLNIELNFQLPSICFLSVERLLMIMYLCVVVPNADKVAFPLCNLSTLFQDCEQPHLSQMLVCEWVYLFKKPLRGQAQAMQCFLQLHLSINAKVQSVSCSHTSVNITIC